MSTNPPLHLDHLILLLPHSTLHALPTSLTSAFTLTPGGRHADNITENKLICFRDGSYIELISFIPAPSPTSATAVSEKRKAHWWGGKSDGWIDFALTSSEGVEKFYEALEGRMRGAGLGYQEPVKGGRKRPDGRDVKWAVTFPEVGEEKGGRRGRVPFFCHDVTERGLRVPLGEEGIRHPCGAVGVKRIEVVVPEGEVEGLGDVYAKILGTKPEGGDGEKVFRVGSVHGMRGSKDPVIVIRGPRGEDEVTKVAERGFFMGNVVVGAVADEGKNIDQMRIDVEEDLGGWFVEAVEKGERERSGAVVGS